MKNKSRHLVWVLLGSNDLYFIVACLQKFRYCILRYYVLTNRIFSLNKLEIEMPSFSFIIQGLTFLSSAHNDWFSFGAGKSDTAATSFAAPHFMYIPSTILHRSSLAILYGNLTNWLFPFALWNRFSSA